MPTSGTTFTDWEQVETERRRPLLVDDDFSWSEPPVRRRRPVTPEPTPARRRRAAADYEAEYSEYDVAPSYADEPAPPAPLASAGAERLPDGDGRLDVEHELDTAWGGRLSAPAADANEVVPYSFEDEAEIEPSGRRTVVITGRGAGHYSTSRRHAEAGLAFHERAGFNPDRMAMWAVLLGIALMLGCIAH